MTIITSSINSLKNYRLLSWIISYDPSILESSALGHSYLTYALVEEGLKTPAADKNGDKQVDLREWFDYAVQRVPNMRHERVEQSAKQQGKALELVEVTEQGKVQTPRVFYRREPDTQPLVVAKTGAATLVTVCVQS